MLDLGRWGQEKLDRVRASNIARYQSLESREEILARLQKTGTTVFAMKFSLAKKGKEVPAVVIAADGRMTTEWDICTDETKKIHPIDEYTSMGYAGLIADCEMIRKIFRIEVRHTQNMQEGDPLSLVTKARKLERLSQEIYEARFLLAGYNQEEERCAIYSVSVGVAHERDRFGGIGSGYESLVVHLDTCAGGSFSMEAILEFAKKSLSAAAQHDRHSGGVLRACVITATGSKEVVLS